MKAILVAATALLLASCTKPEPPAPIEEHRLHGVVLRLDAQARIATVKHSVMGDYEVRDKEQFDKLHAGEWIDATAKSQGRSYWLEDIQPAKP